MLQSLDAVISRAMRGIEITLGAALLLSIALNFINVLARYVFSKSILGIDEIQIYSMIWITFVGAAVVTLRGENLRMDALVKGFPGWLIQALRVTELLALLVLGCFMVWVSLSYARNVLGMTSTVGQIPMIIPHSSVAVGYTLIVFVVVRHLLRGGRL